MTISTDHTRAEIDQARDIANKVEAKAKSLLLPMEREMKVMQWGPDFRQIMWEAIARLAIRRSMEAANDRR